MNETEALTNLRDECEKRFLEWNARDKKVVNVSQIADSYRDLMLACNSMLHALELEGPTLEALKAKEQPE